ncbi:MAG: DUF58 domain-containing protein [Planctomycetaceae bacterium]|nr:DUF58 domain-containing protein [Planctomycetaceae bacterium]
MVHDPIRRHLSVGGIAAMTFGFAVLAAEFRYGVFRAQAGDWARLLVGFAAIVVAAWGLKELIRGWWPGLKLRSGLSRRNRFMLPVEGQVYCLIMVVLFCGSSIGRSNTLLLVFALMAGPFIVNGGITYLMLKKLTVRRTLPRRVMAGEPFSIELELINPKRWWSAWLMSVRDRVGNGREELQPEVLFTRVARRSQETGRYQLRLSQRGRYEFGPLQINSRFPLGLVERGLILSSAAEILVYPRIGRFTSSWRKQLLTATQLVSQAQPRGVRFDDDFHRIREYRPGDDPRAIHWRTSARRDELMVREFRESRDRHLILLLDMHLPPQPTEAQRQRLEFALSLAATIYHDQLQSSRGTDVHFAANSAPFQEWSGTSRIGRRDEFLDLLALLNPGRSAEMKSLFDVALREQTPHSRIVLITPEASRAEQWDVAQSLPRSNGDQAVAIEPPQLIVADPKQLAGIFSLSH